MKIASIYTCSALSILVWAILFTKTGCMQAGSGNRDDFAEVPLQPREYKSPSGEFSLHVNPSRRDGQGKCECRLLKGAETLWTKELPFTLFECVVNDTGRSAGYGYSHGIQSHRNSGSLVITLIASDGEIVIKEELQRTPSTYIHGRPHPMMRGIVVDEKGGRVLFRIDMTDEPNRSERWMTYSMELMQKQESSDVQDSRWIVGMRCIPGTRFFVAQHWIHDAQSEGSLGASYQVYDQDAKVFWTLEKPIDFATNGMKLPHEQLRRFQEQTMISTSGQPNQFEIQLVSESKRVTFEVVDSDASCDIREVARVDSPLSPLPNETSTIDRERFVELTEKGKIRFGNLGIASTPIRSVQGFDLNANDQVGFIRVETSKPDSFVLLDASGKVLRQMRLEIDELEGATWNGVACTGANQFVITQSQIGLGAGSRAWLVQPDRNNIELLEPFASPSIDCVSGYSDGSFVVLSSDHLQYTITEAVSYFDSKGRQQWSKESSSSNSPDAFLNPESVCISSTGNILVLDNIQNAVCIYDPSGKFLGRHELEQLWGRKPNYLSEISKTPKGGYCIYDFSGNPCIVVSDAKGRIVRSMKCRRGADLDDINPQGSPKVDSKEGVLLSDGEAFYSVGPKGIATNKYGEPPIDKLGKSASVAVFQERIYVQSLPTGAVHVFDLEGQPIHVLYDRRLANHASSRSQIQVADNQDVYVRIDNEWQSSRWLRFSKEGKLLDEQRLGSQEMCALPSNRFIESDFDRIRIVDAKGATLKQIDRQPDGYWLGRSLLISVAKDGSFAVASSLPSRDDRNEPCVSLYSREGEPIRTVSLDRMRINNLDFDGDRIVVTSKHEAFVWSATGNPLYRVHWQSGDKEPWLRPKVTVDGTELLLVDTNEYRSDMRRFLFPK